MTNLSGNYYYEPAVVNYGPYSLMGTVYIDQSTGDDRLALSMGKRSPKYDAKKHCIRLDKNNNNKEFLIVTRGTDISIAEATKNRDIPYEPLTRFLADVRNAKIFDKGILNKFVKELGSTVNKINLERAARIKV